MRNKCKNTIKRLRRAHISNLYNKIIESAEFIIKQSNKPSLTQEALEKHLFDLTFPPIDENFETGKQGYKAFQIYLHPYKI